MRKYLLLIAAFFLTLGASAQLQVKENSFKEIPGFVNTNQEFQTDDNEKPFSVIVIKLSNITDQQARELDFDGDLRTYFEIEYKKGELWLYTSYYATFIKISHPDLSIVEFHLPFDMEGGKGYEMVLENKASTLNEGYASISIITRPEDGAFVTLNGTVMSSTTPYKNPRIHSGRYTITVSKEFFRTVTKVVDINPNENKIIEIDMPLDAAYITFKADNETKIYVDDALLSTGGWTGRMTAGAYSVRYEKDKHKPVTQTIVVKPNQDAEYELQLIPMTGNVSVTTNPRAQINIDGVNHGKAPKTIKQLLVGEHTITLTRKKYGPIQKTFTVNENQTTNINETLHKYGGFGAAMRGLGRRFSNDSYESLYVALEVDQNQYNKFAYGVSMGYHFQNAEFIGIYGSFTARNLLKDFGKKDGNKECDNSFLVDGYYPWYSGRSTIKQWAAHAGIILDNEHALSYRIGVGYGEFDVYYQTDEIVSVSESSTQNGQTTTKTENVKMWAHNKDVSYKGLEISLGLQLYTGDDVGLLWKVDFIYNVAGIFGVKYAIGIGG